MSNINIEDILWIEKYRPKNLEEMVLDTKLKSRMKDVIANPKHMPHFLFIGTQGTGKTTLARILISSIIQDESDVLVINGSDQRGIEIFRTTIPEFLSVSPLLSPIKIVFIDEGDNLTSDAKKIFRALLEKYHNYARFIITANEDTFTGPIKSRFEVIQFVKHEKQFIFQLCERILTNEKVNYNKSDIEYVIKLFYPDTRKIVGVLQQCTIEGNLDIRLLQLSNEDTLLNLTFEMIKSILGRDTMSSNMHLVSISRFISNNYVDFISYYKQLFNKLSYKCIPLKVIISRYLNQTINSISPSMVFYEFIYELKNSCEKLVGLLTMNDILE